MSTYNFTVSGNGSQTLLRDVPLAGANWIKVTGADDDTSYVYTISNIDGASVSLQDTYNIATFPRVTAVQNLTTTFRARYNTAGLDHSGRVVLYLSGTSMYGATWTLTTGYINYSDQFLVSPFSGIAWTQTELDNLELGIELTTSVSTGQPVRCTLVSGALFYSPVMIKLQSPFKVTIAEGQELIIRGV